MAVGRGAEGDREGVEGVKAVREERRWKGDRNTWGVTRVDEGEGGRK